LRKRGGRQKRSKRRGKRIKKGQASLQQIGKKSFTEEKNKTGENPNEPSKPTATRPGKSSKPEKKTKKTMGAAHVKAEKRRGRGSEPDPHISDKTE